MSKKKLKVGVKEGGGPPPGYKWSVGLIGFIAAEALDLLGKAGYCHLAMQVRELATQDDPTHSDIVDVRPVESVHEIRDKGAPFGGANVRLFFGVDKEQRVIVPLGTIVKQNNGKTPQPDKILMKNRWRRYCEGAYGSLKE